MKVKVVGGPRDGETVSLNEGERDIKLHDPLPPSTYKYGDPFTATGPAISWTVYTVRYLRSRPDWQLIFLAPADWSDTKAIEHQFQK
jgi:hypothetical protein